MIVTCPNCSTRYQLDAGALVPSGRALRCVRCGHTWTQRPVSDTAARVVEEEPEAEEIEVPDFGLDVPSRPRRAGRTPASARRRERGRAKRSRQAAGSGGIGWFVLAGVVVAVLAGLYFLRAEVVSYFPPAQRAYDLAGLDTSPPVTIPGEGLRILENTIKSSVLDDDDGRTIDIEGEVQNVTRSTRAVPPVMQVILLDRNKEVVGEWKFRSPVTVLGPTDKFTFRTSVLEASTEAVEIQVTFVTEGQVQG